MKSLPHSEMVANLETVFSQASTETVLRGMDWYFDVHREISKIVNGLQLEGFSLPTNALHRFAGVIAALSPRLAWEKNLSHAERLVKALLLGQYDLPALNLGILGNVSKAAWIWEHGTVALLGGLKTWAFYDNIAFPQTSGLVTCDVWAIRAATGDLIRTEGLKQEAYNAVSNAYCECAKTYEILPHQFQAIIWETIRSKKPTPEVKNEDDE